MVLHGRVVRKLEALYDEIVGAGHAEPMILPLDLAKADADDFGNVASALQAQLGRLDALVHTAACSARSGRSSISRSTLARRLLRVNVAAPMGLTRALMPLLSRGERRERHLHARQSRRAATRLLGRLRRHQGGVATLARELADEWENRENLRVNAVIPGPIRSPLRSQYASGGRPLVAAVPEALVPLYLHLIGGQTKADSGMLIDAQDWLAGRAIAKCRCARSAAARAGAENRPPGSMSGKMRIDRDQNASRRAATRVMSAGDRRVRRS